MHPALCASCDQMTEVPFKPRGDRPVYCRTCYDHVRPKEQVDSLAKDVVAKQEDVSSGEASPAAAS